MDNVYEKLLREVEEQTQKHAPISGAEVWQAILAASKQVPESLRQVFTVQVLVSIFDNQPIAREALENSLQSASSSIQRVQEYLKERVA